jgi:uncharacterized protein YggL (DUF469 family)
LSTDIRQNAEEINRHYENLNLAFIPSEMRAEHSTHKPFALVDQYEQTVIKELTEAEARNLGFLLQWLWENDSKRHSKKELYDRFQKEVASANKDKKDAIKESFHEELDVINTMARSNKHTYKLPDGRKIG